MALTNTIEVTQLNFNTLGTNKFFIQNLSSNIALNAGQTIYWQTTGQGVVTYTSVQGEPSLFMHNMTGTNISGYTGAIYSNPARTNIIGGTFTPVIKTDTGNNRQYTSLDFNIYDADGNISLSDSTSNLVFYPNDDAGGPSSIISNPGFISIGEPLSIKSTLNATNAGSARVRYVGVVSQTDPNDVDQNTITTLNGRSPALFYPSNGGVWIGIDVEPSLNNEDYLYTFFADSTCYHSQTILETENGPMCIKDIERGMLVKTRNGFKKVVRVLSNGCKLKDFVVFEKGSLGENIPNQDLMITKGHPVYYQGKYLNSLEFVKNNFFDKIYIKRLETDGLHHIQFETHECVLTNNLWTTSLPHNMGNKIPEELYFDKSLYDPDDKGKHYPPYCLHVDPPNDELDDDDLEHISQFE